jgi:prepilin-type N-terminal cleavage/methylation domain-containing protein
MNKSFTLIEILVVIVVIGIISSFIIVGLSSVSDKANIAKGQAFSNSLRNSLLMNLVSEWKLDGNTNDSWGVNNGSVVGSPVYKTISDCVNKECVELNGTTDYISLNSVTSFANEFTITAWVYRDTNNTYDMILGNAGTDMKIGLSLNTNKLFVRIIDGGSADTSNSDNLLINKWHFVVVTRDSNNKIDSYVNANNPKRLFADIAQPGTYQFNRIGMCTDNFFDGKIDDIDVFNKKMPISFVGSEYYSGLNKLILSSTINKEEFNQGISFLSVSLENN